MDSGLDPGGCSAPLCGTVKEFLAVGQETVWVLMTEWRKKNALASAGRCPAWSRVEVS